MTDTLILQPSQAGHVAKGRREFRDEQLFARLIGAAVLLALAVIVLPFVLDGSGTQREYEYAETLPLEPPRPTAPVVEKSFSSRQQPDTEVPVAPTRASVEVNVPETTPTDGLQAPSVTTASATVDSTTNLANQVATAASGSTTVAQPPAAGTDNVNNTPIQAGWNIQVASFIRDANALKLLNKLRAQNLPAYANQVTGETRTVIRVLVGPYNNQIDALALQNRIDQDYRVESLMVRR